MRSIYYTHLYRALKAERPNAEKQRIMEKFFENLKGIYMASPLWLEFPDDVTLHIMVLRKTNYMTNE